MPASPAIAVTSHKRKQGAVGHNGFHIVGLQPITKQEPSEPGHLIASVKLYGVVACGAWKIVEPSLLVVVAVAPTIAQVVLSIDPEIYVQSISVAWPELETRIPHHCHGALVAQNGIATVIKQSAPGLRRQRLKTRHSQPMQRSIPIAGVFVHSLVSKKYRS